MKPQSESHVSKRCEVTFSPDSWRTDAIYLRATIVAPRSEDDEQNKQWERLCRSIFEINETYGEVLEIFRLPNKLGVVLRVKTIFATSSANYDSKKNSILEGVSQLEDILEARESS